MGSSYYLGHYVFSLFMQVSASLGQYILLKYYTFPLVINHFCISEGLLAYYCYRKPEMLWKCSTNVNMCLCGTAL